MATGIRCELDLPDNLGEVLKEEGITPTRKSGRFSRVVENQGMVIKCLWLHELTVKIWAEARAKCVDPTLGSEGAGMIFVSIELDLTTVHSFR